jgi:hypothetical protein
MFLTRPSLVWLFPEEQCLSSLDAYEHDYAGLYSPPIHSIAKVFGVKYNHLLGCTLHLNGLDIRVHRANLTPRDILAAEDFITKTAPLIPGGYCHIIFGLSIFLSSFYTKIITT